MRILIVSDLHANLEALRRLPSVWDELWVLGDLVNYGPNPCEVIEFVRAHAALVVSGNHDHAVAWDEDPRCSHRFRRMAEETGRYTKSVITEDQRAFLRGLPRTAARECAGVRFLACHAAPRDPLYEYRAPESPLWEEESSESTDVLLVGHTHLPFCRCAGRIVVLNPGSVGQPKHGRAQASYALWDDGEFRLESVDYPVEETVAKISALPLSPEARTDLISVLRSGSALVRFSHTVSS